MLSDAGRALRAASLAVAAVWLPVIVLFGPAVHDLTYDDAYYYFQIGRNVADGAGSTFDGLHVTNGYHPLWMLVTAAVYLVGLDDLTAVRAILVLQLALWVAGLLLLARVIARAVGGWPALRGRADGARASRLGNALLAALWFALGANPYVLKLFVSGMETGIAALVGIGLLALAARHDGDPLVRPVHAGALACLLFLARTDTVFLVGALLLWHAIGHRRVTRTVLAVGAAFSATSTATDSSSCGGQRARRPRAASKLPRLRAWFGATAWWASGSLLLLAYEWGFTTEIYLWHYAPQILYGLATIPHAVADIFEGATTERPADHPAAASRSRAVAAILAAPFLLGGLWQVTRITDPELRSMQLGDRTAGEWVAANLPEDAVIGSFDAGVFGYFADRTVVNLDGLVNSYDWYDARLEGVEATSAFLRDAGVSHVANHGDPVDGDEPRLRAAIDDLLGDDAGQRMELVHREDFVFNGTAGGVSGRRPYATFVWELAPADRP